MDKKENNTTETNNKLEKDIEFRIGSLQFYEAWPRDILLKKLHLSKCPEKSEGVTRGGHLGTKYSRRTEKEVERL